MSFLMELAGLEPASSYICSKYPDLEDSIAPPGLWRETPEAQSPKKQGVYKIVIDSEFGASLVWKSAIPKRNPYNLTSLPTSHPIKMMNRPHPMA